jgi:hypothetical protein
VRKNWWSVHGRKRVLTWRKSVRSHLASTEEFPGSELTAEQVEFGKAIERYKRDHLRPYPEWWEVLMVFKSLGYRK